MRRLKNEDVIIRFDRIYERVTDGQIDRRTDGHRIASRGKNRRMNENGKKCPKSCSGDAYDPESTRADPDQNQN